VTLPVEALASSGLAAGDEVTIEAAGPDTIILRRTARNLDLGFGVFDGLYEPDYLDRLRSGERA
jgi:bifunctional DNA-binding transcriptional regulator/antitoxin component of YhaV-PrlF toxin-antitoxin module